MSIYGDMIDLAGNAMERQNSSVRMPSPFGGSLKIPMAALGRMGNNQAPVYSGRRPVPYNPMPSEHGGTSWADSIRPKTNHIILENIFKSVPKRAQDFRDYENKAQGFRNLPYMRPATGSYVPTWGAGNAVQRPFLPGTGGGYDGPATVVTPDVRNYLNELNSMLGR